MIILKLGGSVITDKSRPFSFREEVSKRIAEEIAGSGVQGLVIVHGGGSFGHPVAAEHGLQKGLSGGETIIGVSKTRAAMAELNTRVVGLLMEAGLPAISIQTSAVFTCESGRIDSASMGVISDFTALGMVPVLYGDVVIDRRLGVCILSGDQIVSYLARHLKASRVCLATDVEGVLDEKGRLIQSVREDDAEDVINSIPVRQGDVTGGMRGKVEELVGLARSGTSSVVFNALAKDRLRNALLGKTVKGTVFEAKST